ncbi:uncharacterized protein MONOS_3921 [Monocercomonoides exilis]|uniref:uncharacterized protein n=1 Tax=Monocercomonoides exilis TaxID=2049356 RepID=UPI00355A30F3|nr:hypothetical protein MONOS_3921 [Monocercomonoides exilis]|eukprot:MONOS_3921.1-p1 / transcript=MONOS_3921.1 / gene=MONOS_3921 / organism=Monocercomonoides_exilis_PA203 / gene_product=unspecified product / transcript_product=unspecified product / location=Mono_scaffold00097:80691-81185(+) / protein_length=165 / sequence_SO=supercontig / SO=protein_coding / is_pseudo=false
MKESLFSFMMNITQKDNSIAGHDRTDPFGDWDVDLFIFIDRDKADKVFVDGKSGVEEMRCGLEKALCENVNYRMERLKRTHNIKEEIILSAKSSLRGSADVGGLCVKAKSETIVEIECQTEVNGSEENCILKLTSLSEMKFIEIVVSSSFNRSISAVIESSAED